MYCNEGVEWRRSIVDIIGRLKKKSGARLLASILPPTLVIQQMKILWPQARSSAYLSVFLYLSFLVLPSITF